MLQVKDLVKKYVMKGETVEALKGITIDFPETGMVFLLGKSGSGKSTLLNIAGGLDAPDGGEVIVAGRSSADFSEADFDSYRNTFIGFVFQEYNVLNELTVRENVSLAVELQGRAADPARVEEILREVELEGLADRRPNTLSGGQKQRVAIARALVKNPKIVMADEPTGALDSATGKQVFDTLKKLSRDKLVVVVSHDREFAELYADRIIELADGRIISDVSRGEGKERGNLNVLNEKKLAVSRGALLTEEEEREILAFLKKSKGGIVISAEETEAVSAGGEGFVSTALLPQPEKKEEKREEFIRSRLPFRYAVKMAVSSLRVKPLRLVFTTLLATIAFLVFGVFSTLVTFTEASAGQKTLAGADYNAAVLMKYGVFHCRNGENEYTRQIKTGITSNRFSQAEIDEIEKKYPNVSFIPAFTQDYGAITFRANKGDPQGSNAYYGGMGGFTAFAHVSDYRRLGGELVAGEWPTAPNEAVISKEVFDSFAYYGLVLTVNGAEQVSTYQDILGKAITVSVSSTGPSGGTVTNTLSFVIVGITDTKEDFSAYDFLKERNRGYSSEQWEKLSKTFSEEIYGLSFASLLYVSDDYEPVANRKDYYSVVGYDATYFASCGYFERDEAGNYVKNEYGQYKISEAAEAKDACYQYLFARLNRASAKAVMELDSLSLETDVDYEAPYAFMEDVRLSRRNLNTVFAVLGVAAAVLAVFSALLLFNFISVSINAKRRDIGILRAVGARGSDVFQIFAVEGAIITLFCFALGTLGALGACALANHVLFAKGVLSYMLFIFGLPNLAMILGVALATAVLSTAIPVSLAVRKKPVETIRAL